MIVVITTRKQPMRKFTMFLGAGVAVAAVSILGSYAFAQQGSGFGQGHMGMGHGMGPGMMMGKGHGPMTGTFGDPVARLAALNTEIGITPAQQIAWDAYVKVVTETAGAMQAHRGHATPDAIHKMEPKQRQDFAATMQTQRQNAFAKVKAAAEDLLAQLDDAQKAKARDNLPGLVAAGHASAMRHGMMGADGMGPPFKR